MEGEVYCHRAHFRVECSCGVGPVLLLISRSGGGKYAHPLTWLLNLKVLQFPM
jgi:hypothetical protein